MNKITVHPEYTDIETLKNDLAMLELEKPVDFTDTIRPICLPGEEKKDLDGVQATVVGFGWIDDEGTFPNQLMKAQVDITTNQDCREKFEKTGQAKFIRKIVDTNLCAGGQDKGGSCKGGLFLCNLMI